MKKKQQSRQRDTSKITKKRIIIYGGIGAIVAIIAIFAYSSFNTVNAGTVFAIPNNHFIHATNSGTAWQWISASSGSVKGVGGGTVQAGPNPTYSFNLGEVEAVHITNDDYQTKSQHNFNIDEFNVHTKTLNYFESQTITFVANQKGTFHYYCTIHPEMRGDIEVK